VDQTSTETNQVVQADLRTVEAGVRLERFLELRARLGVVATTLLSEARVVESLRKLLVGRGLLLAGSLLEAPGDGRFAPLSPP